MLQDAWASWFHDDLYKDSSGVLPMDVYQRARILSDNLHALDKEAQGIINEIATQRLNGAGRIKMKEAIDKQLYAMAAVGASVMAESLYSRVHRSDRYVVGPEAIFDFTIDAECHKPAPFSMLIAGDTPNTQMSIESVEQINRFGTYISLSKNGYRVTRLTHPNRVVILKRSRCKAKRHHYRVVCCWPGVFDLPLESIWCPWRTLYPNAEVEYRLEIEFLQMPHSAPRILRPSEFASLDAAIKDYTDGKGEEGDYRHDAARRRHIFRFEPKKAGDMLCFFMP
jgi:hypothetical protein